MRWVEIVLVVFGGFAFILVGFFLAGKAQDAFASPSGVAHGWAIGVFVLLLVGIIGISAVFSWIRRREREVDLIKQTESLPSTKVVKKAL